MATIPLVKANATLSLLLLTVDREQQLLHQEELEAGFKASALVQRNTWATVLSNT